MKNLFIFILLIMSVFVSFGQDTEMLGFINKYRIAHGKKTLVIDTSLNRIAEDQTNIIIAQSKVTHSHKSEDGENCTIGYGLPNTIEEKNKLITFLKVNFNITYAEPTNDNEINTLVKLYIIYCFDQSPPHKTNMLGNFLRIGFYNKISDKKTLKPNYWIVCGQKRVFKGMVSYYEVNFYSVIDFGL